MDSHFSSAASSRPSSGHSSEGHDDFLENHPPVGASIMQERFRSRSLSHSPAHATSHTPVPPRIFLLPPDDSPPPIRAQPFLRRKLEFGRSVSVDAPSIPSHVPSANEIKARKRSKSCAGEIPGLADRPAKRQPRIRKISTNSLGSFGRGFEGLLLSKPEVLISPVISAEPSPEPKRKETEPKTQSYAATDSEIETDPETQPQLRTHLDHGYAWVIVFGASLAFFVGGGFGRCFPLIYQRLQERFGSSVTATAWVAALHSAVKLCSSPLVSAMCKRFGIRAVVMVGGLVTAGGLLISAFPPSLVWIYLTYSTISAIGSNMVHAPSFIIVGQYFDKKKGTAMAIATTCLTLGGVAFAPLIEVLFAEYAYSGAMVIVSALMLHYCVTGSLYRPPPDQKTKPIHPSRQQTKPPQCHPPTTNQTRESEPRLGRTNQQAEETSRDLLSTNGKQAQVTLPRASQSTVIQVEEGNAVSVSIKQKPCLRKFLSNIYSGLKIFGVYLGLPLLCDKDCLGYGLLMGAAFWAFGITNTFVAGLAHEVAGVGAKEMAVMLSVTSASDIVCRLASGVIFDVKRLKQHRTGMLLWIATGAGVTTALLPFASSYASFFVVLAACSGTKSALHTQHVTVLAQLVGPRKLAPAMGLMRFFQGVGVMVGLAVGGVLTDLLGTYQHAFTVGGASLILATAVFTSRHYCFATPTSPKATPTAQTTPTSPKATPTSQEATPTSQEATPISTKDSRNSTKVSNT